MKESGRYTNRNRATLVRGGKDYFNKLIQVINRAKTCIHLQFYIYDDDETGRRVTAALEKAVQKGVSVFMLVDGYASQTLSRSSVNAIKKSGIRFKWFEPFFKSRHFYFGRRLHHKVLVADGLYALVGGANVCDRYNDMPGKPAWLDYAVYCEGEVSHTLHLLCHKMWGNKEAKDPVSPEDIDTFCSTIPIELRQRIAVKQNDWVKRKNQVTETYSRIFASATESVTLMCSYFLPGRTLRKLILNAVERGVKITLILASESDVIMTKHAERYLYEWMLNNGIIIYEYQQNVLHAKVAACDGRLSTIGSYNVNNISAYASLELNLEINNEPFTEHLEQELEQIANFYCKEIRWENFTASNNFFRRFWQRFCYYFINNVLNLFTFYFKRE